MARTKDKEPSEQRRHRTCATMEEHRRLAHLYPEYRRRRREIELETRQFIARYAAEGLRTGVVRIPVVVHVVWNTAAQNVSDAQIQSQIDVLNADFRRTNADAASVPAHFSGVAADARIEFALAVRDPNCGATTGITRTNTATTGFTKATRNNVKSAATGGADPWPSDRYLNMWVANFTDDLLGFATFPGGPATLDGFVVDTQAFGTMGTASAPVLRMPKYRGSHSMQFISKMATLSPFLTPRVSSKLAKRLARRSNSRQVSSRRYLPPDADSIRLYSRQVTVWSGCNAGLISTKATSSGLMRAFFSSISVITMSLSSRLGHKMGMYNDYTAV